MDVSGLRCGERRAEVTEISYSDLNLEVSGFSLDFEGKGNPSEEIADLRTQKVQRGHSLLDIFIVFLAPSLFLLLLYFPTFHLFFPMLPIDDCLLMFPFPSSESPPFHSPH